MRESIRKASIYGQECEGSASIIRVETASRKVLFEEEGERFPNLGKYFFRVFEFSLINFYRR